MSNLKLSLAILSAALVVTVLSLPAVPLSSGDKVHLNLPFNPETDDNVPVDRYLTHDEMSVWLQGIAKRYPKLAVLKSIGKSVQGRDLWVLELSHSVGRGKRDLLMPMMKLVGNIHGNEPVGRQLLLRMISYMITSDPSDKRINRLLNTTDIFFLPSMNPDGFSRAKEGDCWQGDKESGRTNDQDLDLNRNFPDQFRPNDDSLRSRSELLDGRAPETQAVMNWILENPFVLSASLHGGAVVVSYPFDDSKDHEFQGYYSSSPDDQVFKRFSQDYADRHPTMKLPETCGAGFKDGITNGAYWYDLTGGMQDFNYVYSNSFEVTLELSCCKYPNGSELPVEWNNNRRPLLNFIASSHRGVRGLILDKETQQPIPKAYVVVDGINKNITSTERGEYWRLLVPGSYHIQSFAEGYVPSEKKKVEITEKYAEMKNFEMVRQRKQVMARLTCY